MPQLSPLIWDLSFIAFFLPCFFGIFIHSLFLGLELEDNKNYFSKDFNYLW